MMDIKQLYGDSKKILIIGTYPPPLGGISVFIYRLKKILQKENYEVDVFNTALRYKFFGFKFIAFIYSIVKGKYQIIHIQNFDLKKIISLLIIKPLKDYKIFYTSHNPFLFDKKTQFFIWVTRVLLAKMDKLIVVNSHILENYQTYKVNLPENVMVSNAFLPPPLEDKDKIWATYPIDFISFMETHSPLVMANAYQIKFIDGIDLYVLDMCIELTKNLKNQFPQIGFIFCLANEKANPHSFNKVISKIESDDLYGNFYFLTSQKELWPLFERIHLFIRPTYKDGYGVSIDEALFFDCPAIASDACERNPKAIIFENRNAIDLYEKCIQVLKNKIL